MSQATSPDFAPSFPGAVWTSFDRYARYGAIVETVRACLGDGLINVLDVGDPSGYLTIFDDNVSAVCADLTLADDALVGTVRIAADGTRLPFPDGTFDAVVSSDVLEHVPPAFRGPFLNELARVSTDVVVVAAPFATPGVEGAEALARRYALLVTGVPQDQLEEHAANGLPQLSDTVDQLRAAGLDVAIEGNGNLHDWLLMMMLKHQLIARPALLPLDDAYDMAYNLALSARNHVAPYYRHLVCGRRGGSPSFAPQSSVTYDGSDESLALIGSWLTATAAELGRQDVATEVGVLHNRSEHIEERLARLEAAVLGLVPRLDALSEGLAENRVAISDVRTVVGDVQAVVAHTHELIRHPVRSMVGKAQKRNE